MYINLKLLLVHTFAQNYDWKHVAFTNLPVSYLMSLQKRPFFKSLLSHKLIALAMTC